MPILLFLIGLIFAECANYVSTIAGTGSGGNSGNGGAATSAALYWPMGIELDSSGNVFFAERYNHVVRKITVSNGILSLVAGSCSTSAASSVCTSSTSAGSFCGDGGAATSACLNNPFQISLDSSDNLYIADTTNHRIRKVTNGVITTIAGTGTGGYDYDGIAATSAKINSPFGVAIDSSGNVYIGDGSNNRIRKVAASNGYISTVAGTGTAGWVDGTSATFTTPTYLAIYSGNLYISDRYSHKIRKLEVTTGIVSSIAGTGATGSTGDGGAATSATLNNPLGIAFDSSGNYLQVNY